MSIQPATHSAIPTTPVVPHSTPPSTMLRAPEVRRFSVDEYHRMIETGIFTTRDNVELVDGWIIEMAPIGPPHSTSTTLAEAAVRRVLSAGSFVRSQLPITLPSGEPQPDLVVAKGEPRDYSQRHPGPDQIALVIEIAERTLEFDRTAKIREYAAAGISEYWIVNLLDRQLEVHRDPHMATTGAEYRLREIIPATGAVTLSIAGQNVGVIQVVDLLP